MGPAPLSASATCIGWKGDQFYPEALVLRSAAEIEQEQRLSILNLYEGPIPVHVPQQEIQDAETAQHREGFVIAADYGFEAE